MSTEGSGNTGAEVLEVGHASAIMAQHFGIAQGYGSASRTRHAKLAPAADQSRHSQQRLPVKVPLSARLAVPESLAEVKDGGVAHRHRARDGTQHVHQPAQTNKGELKKKWGVRGEGPGGGGWEGPNNAHTHKQPTHT